MMGIREEIEKIPICASLDWPLHDRGVFCDGQRLMKAEALSILDKWECIGEKTFYYAGWAMLQEGDLTDSKPVLPGDHIIILRRRKDE